MEQTYQELMTQLRNVTTHIAVARKHHDDMRKALDMCKRNVDGVKAEIVISAGGYSALGKNAEEREYKLIELIRKNSYYTAAIASLRDAENREMDAKRTLENLKTEFDSLRHQVDGFSSYVKYSALVASNPAAADLLNL